jgi:hypothetical protein
MFKDKSSLKVVNKPIYAALYFFPLLIITHITAGGVLCKHKQKLNVQDISLHHAISLLPREVLDGQNI